MQQLKSIIVRRIQRQPRAERLARADCTRACVKAWNMYVSCGIFIHLKILHYLRLYRAGLQGKSRGVNGILQLSNGLNLQIIVF